MGYTMNAVLYVQLKDVTLRKGWFYLRHFLKQKMLKVEIFLDGWGGGKPDSSWTWGSSKNRVMFLENNEKQNPRSK